MTAKASVSGGSANVRYGLLEVVLLITVWSIVLGVMRILGFPLRGFVIAFLILLTVAFLQFLFRRVHHPYIVSIAAGISFVVIAEPLLRWHQGLPVSLDPVLLLLGATYGLVAGLCVRIPIKLAAAIRSRRREQSI